MLTLDNDKEQVADETLGFFREAIARRMDPIASVMRGAGGPQSIGAAPARY